MNVRSVDAKKEVERLVTGKVLHFPVLTSLLVAGLARTEADCESATSSLPPFLAEQVVGIASQGQHLSLFSTDVPLGRRRPRTEGDPPSAAARISGCWRWRRRRGC
jgi:hypothetical protein